MPAEAEVGQLVADALGYVLVDEEIVQQAAASQGISVDELADVERRTTFMDRFLQNLAAGGGGDGYMLGIAAMAPPAAGAERPEVAAGIDPHVDRGDR